MIVQKTFRYRLEPTGKQGQIFARFGGCCRFVFNFALAARKLAYVMEGKTLSFVEQCLELTALKRAEATRWLSEVHSQVLQQALKDLDAAYQHFFRRVKTGETPGFPRFKKKGVKDSFRYTQGVKVRAGKVYFPKIGWVRFRDSRPVEGKIQQATIKRDGDHWFVSFSCEVSVPDPTHASNLAVGIDLGVASFASLSDGTQIEPLGSFRKYEARLAQAQRKLSVRRKGSRNFYKLKATVRRIQARIANARRDFLHKISTTICKNHAVVVIEDLNVRGMSASAKGTVEEPGRNVRAKSGLNKSILDQGWGMFRSMLEYKAKWLGGQVIAINPANTSRTCPACGGIDADNRRTQAEFRCVRCGHADQADVNAARNILRAGLARARFSGVRGSKEGEWRTLRAAPCLAANAVESPAQGSNLFDEVLAGTSLASATPGIPRL